MKTTTLSLLLLTTLAVSAEPAANRGEGEADSSHLSLGAVTSAVLADNPAIKEALRKWDAMKERIPQAAAWDDLKISAESEFKRFVQIQPNAFMDQALSVEQVFPTSGKNRARGRVAAAEALSAYEDVRRAQLNAISAARASYFRLADVYDQLEINRKNLVSLKQIADISRSKYETGAESAANVIVAETDYSKLLETQRDLERRLSDEQSQLNTLMNRDAFAPIGAPAAAAIEPPDLSVTRLRELTLSHRPELQMARTKIDAEKSRLQLAHREWIPDPAVGVKAQRYNDAAQTVSELDAGISFSVPWGNFRKYSAEVREARDAVAAAEHALDRSQKEALQRLRDQLEKIETAHHHVELFRDKIMPQARQAFEANQFSYESGKASFLDWISAQRNLRDIEATAREHLADYQIAVAELEAITGAQVYPLPEDPKPSKKIR